MQSVTFQRIAYCVANCAHNVKTDFEITCLLLSELCVPGNIHSPPFPRVIGNSAEEEGFQKPKFLTESMRLS